MAIALSLLLLISRVDLNFPYLSKVLYCLVNRIKEIVLFTTCEDLLYRLDNASLSSKKCYLKFSSFIFSNLQLSSSLPSDWLVAFFVFLFQRVNYC